MVGATGIEPVTPYCTTVAHSLIPWPPSFADIRSRRMGMGMGESARQSRMRCLSATSSDDCVRTPSPRWGASYARRTVETGFTSGFRPCGSHRDHRGHRNDPCPYAPYAPYAPYVPLLFCLVMCGPRNTWRRPIFRRAPRASEQILRHACQ
jgi:hypothetical protein